MASISLRQQAMKRRARNLTSGEPDNDASLLDLVDSLLNKGVVVNGDLVLGVAKVDLIYAKLSVLLAALDRAMGSRPSKKKVSRKQRRPRRK